LLFAITLQEEESSPEVTKLALPDSRINQEKGISTAPITGSHSALTIHFETGPSFFMLGRSTLLKALPS
jgi:hypothetical protein